MSTFKILITDFSIFAQTLGKKLESPETEVLYCLPRIDEITKYIKTYQPNVVISERGIARNELIEQYGNADSGMCSFIIYGKNDGSANDTVDLKMSSAHVVSDLSAGETLDRISSRVFEIYRTCIGLNDTEKYLVSDLITKALRELNITPNYSGFYYIEEALTALCSDELSCTDGLCSTIYPFIIQKCNATKTGVERNIRTVLKKSWESTPIKVKKLYFGAAIAMKEHSPSNREFLLVLTDHIKKEMAKNLRGEYIGDHSAYKIR